MTNRLVDAASVEGLHRTFCCTGVVVFNKSVVETFPCKLILNAHRDIRTVAKEVKQILERLAGAFTLSHASRNRDRR